MRLTAAMQYPLIRFLCADSAAHLDAGMTQDLALGILDGRRRIPITVVLLRLDPTRSTIVPCTEASPRSVSPGGHQTNARSFSSI
jgi:hypothetical protein